MRTKSLQPVFAKDLSDHGKKEASFWYDFKFVNPATKKIQVKDQFCESLNQTSLAVARPTAIIFRARRPVFARQFDFAGAKLA